MHGSRLVRKFRVDKGSREVQVNFQWTAIRGSECFIKIRERGKYIAKFSQSSMLDSATGSVNLRYLGIMTSRSKVELEQIKKPGHYCLFKSSELAKIQLSQFSEYRGSDVSDR